MRACSWTVVLGFLFCSFVISSAEGQYVLTWHHPQYVETPFIGHYVLTGQSVANGNVEPERAMGDLDGDALPEILVQKDTRDIVVVDLDSGSESAPIFTLPPDVSLGNAGNTRVLYVDVDYDCLDEAIIWVYGWGMGCIELEASSADDSDSASPTSNLRQSAPNPFNPTTTIGFRLQSPGEVSLSIYDVSGRLVRDLADDVYRAGSHKVLWDGADDSGHELASGTYFYQLRVNGEPVGTQKAVILR